MGGQGRTEKREDIPRNSTGSTADVKGGVDEKIPHPKDVRRAPRKRRKDAAKAGRGKRKKRSEKSKELDSETRNSRANQRAVI